MILDKPTKPDIETDPKELQKKIRFEAWKIRRQNRTLQELMIQQKKIALDRLEVAINTFIDKACVLQLSESGNIVHIKIAGNNTEHVTVNGINGIEMLYKVLKCGFIEGIGGRCS